MNQDRLEAGLSSGAFEGLTPEFLALPAPRHLLEFLTRSQHLHFGYFEAPGDSLPQAQDRLVQRNLRLLPRSALVADVGCGMGGTVNLLAAQGHRVYGFDPCIQSIAYARTRVQASRVQLLVTDMAQFAARARGARFDALFLVEVLAHFTDVPALFAHCRAVLRPGGLLFVHDVVRAAPQPHALGFCSRAALRGAADGNGFDLLESREVSSRTTPTLSRLTRLITERRDELLRVFGRSRPAIARELEDYQTSLRELELAFARQELTYETSVLRCSTRFGTDSVVLRVPSRPALVPRKITREKPLSTES